VSECLPKSTDAPTENIAVEVRKKANSAGVRNSVTATNTTAVETPVKKVPSKKKQGPHFLGVGK